MGSYIFVFTIMLFMGFLGAYVALKRNQKNYMSICIDKKPSDDKNASDTNVPKQNRKDLENKSSEIDNPTFNHKINVANSLTDISCECDGIEEEEYIRNKLKKQDGKFGQKNNHKE